MKLKRFLLLFILLIIFIVLSAISYASSVTGNISNNLLRLHVIANSNRSEDQNLKYIIRDEIIKYVGDLTQNAKSKKEVLAIVKENTSEINQTAKNTILANNYNYDVNIEIGNFAFPTKHYDDIALPAGFYDAIKVEIGEAKGENWWCVMFPPLCFTDVTRWFCSR